MSPAAAYADRLADVLDRLPAGWGLVFAVVVHLFDVEVLRVAVERGESPGDVVVVAEVTKGAPGLETPATWKSPALRSTSYQTLGMVVGDVHVVGHEGFSGGGVGSGDGPFVGADGAVVAGIVAEQLSRELRAQA
jgi:hypothetical protein